MRAKIGQCCTVSLNIAVESFLSDRCSICINKDGARCSSINCSVLQSANEVMESGVSRHSLE